MRIRIRLTSGGTVTPVKQLQRKFALGAASLMTPAAFSAYALGCWRIAADMKWTGEFAISEGIFSHWQVWIALGAVIQVGAITLGRYGRSGNLDHENPA